VRENEKLVTIAEYESGFEAELAKVTLDNEGIESVIFGEDLVVNMPTIESIQIELQVFEKDAVRAKEILSQQEPLADEDSNEQKA
jgi:hypothetical protein